MQKKIVMVIYKFTTKIFLPEEFFDSVGEEIEVNTEFHIENDSIGSYEYWGHKCYDHQPDYIEFDMIDPVVDEKHKPEVEKYINDNWGDVASFIEQEYAKENEPEY